MKELKTLRYEWHLRWEAIDDKGNPERGWSDLVDVGIEQLKHIKERYTFVDITPEDIARGYCLAEDIPEADHINATIVYRIQLARYFESDYGNDIGIAIIRDNQLEDYFDNGVRVPKRFKQEFARNYEWASIL